MKRGIERALVASGAASVARGRQAPSTAILAYHGVVPEGERAAGDAGLHIPRARFAAHLDRLTESHDVVALTEVFRPASADGRSGAPGRGRRRPRCVLTFDDAYLGALTAGMEEVRRRGLTATVFVSPGLLGCEGFWWDRLAPPGEGALDADLREHALGPLGGRQEEVLAWARREGLPLAELPAWARPASEERLDAEVAKGGVTLGAHMWSHPNMAGAEGETLRRELAHTTTWLDARPEVSIPWLAYPYGLHDPASVELARGAVEGALRIRGGLAERRGRVVEDRYRVPRINVPTGLSADGLTLRMAGIGGGTGGVS